ncbi:MAG: polysaccharide deacetylase family protein [Candidatus Sulfotelmatobacter sp.]
MSFRFDRFATLYLVNPFRRSVSRNKPSIPILMYHSISDDAETGVHPYYRTSTSPQQFASQMRYLHESGYRTASLPDVVSELGEQGAVADKHVVITFDDGYRDFHDNAFPILDQYDFSATVFLPTAYIGGVRAQFKGKDCLTWSEIRELQKHGMCFGSHTVTHPQLSTLDAGAVISEIATSKQTIQDNLGESVDSFAYPFAFPENNKPFIQMLRTTLVEAGYRQGVSTRIGTARMQEDHYFLRRLPMNSFDDIPLFEAKLRGSYDWLHKVQYASKRLRTYF